MTRLPENVKTLDQRSWFGGRLYWAFQLVAFIRVIVAHQGHETKLVSQIKLLSVQLEFLDATFFFFFFLDIHLGS